MNPFWNQQTFPQQNPWTQMPTGFNRFNYKPSSGSVMPGWNPVQETGPRNAGAQGYSTPGYPPQGFGQQHGFSQQQGFGQQQFRQPMPNYQTSPEFINQGYGQMPLQPAWEGPKKGGIKEFFSNLMSKRRM